MPLWAFLGLGGVAAYLLLSKNAGAANEQGGASYQGTTLGPGGSSSPIGPAASTLGTSSDDYSTTLGPGGSQTPLGTAASSTGTPDAYTQLQAAAYNQSQIEAAATMVSGYVGANLAPGARHVYVTPSPSPPVDPGLFGGYGATGATFCSNVWAWIAVGSKPPTCPQPGGGRWVLVSALGPDGIVATSGLTPLSLPLWVWYPTGLLTIMPSTEWFGCNVVGAPSPPTGGTYTDGSPITYLEMFPGYWVEAAAYRVSDPTSPAYSLPSAHELSLRRAPHAPRFDPMSGRHY